MAIVLSFSPCSPLLGARRRAAPHARFDTVSKHWSMSEAEYADFWLEAVALRRDRLITVHSVDGRPVPLPQIAG